MSKLSDLAYEKIRQRIVAGEWKVDHPLSEGALASELRISRSPVRDAIRRLEGEGLLVQHPRHGTHLRILDRQEIRELFQMRLLLEPYAAGQAAWRRNPALIRRLEELLAEQSRLAGVLEQGPSPEEQEAIVRAHSLADRNFHEAILRRAGNRRLLKSVDEAVILYLALGKLKDRPEVLRVAMRDTDVDHRRIAEAIGRGDAPAARAAMRQHVIRARKYALLQSS